jgi:hypothetical protein
MKKFIRKMLREHWEWADKPKVETPLSKDLDDLAGGGYESYKTQKILMSIEDKYAEEYAEYPGDSYGVIDVIKKIIPASLKSLYDDIHPVVMHEDESINEDDDSVLRFNDGRFNKDGANTIYMDDTPIIDFGVGGIGSITINGEMYPNSLYLKGGYNAAEQNMGYGTMGLKFIFKKLPKIENIILQCYDTACPFWTNMGGVEVSSKEMEGGHSLRTMLLNRDSFTR